MPACIADIARTAITGIDRDERKMGVPRKEFDWAGIEREYRAGQLSLNEISKRFNISRKYIDIRAAKCGWQRNLGARVHSAFVERIVRADCEEAMGEEVAGEITGDLSDEAIIEGASKRKAAILQHHRRDIGKLRRIVNGLADDLKLLRDSSKGVTTQEVLKQSSVAVNLKGALHSLVSLEREAFSLDEPQDTGGSGATPVTDSLLSELAGLRRRREETDMPPMPDEEGDDADDGGEEEPDTE